MKIPTTAAVLLVVCAVAIAACGASRTITETVTNTTTQTVTQTITKRVTTPAPKPAATHTTTGSSQAVSSQTHASGGSTETVQDFSGNTLAVTSDGIVDPATPANQFYAPQSGTRLVALVVTLSDQGPGTIDNDANTDMSVVGTDGQDYTPSFNGVSQCTNFNHGEYTLPNGETQRGCVVFQLPNGVNVKYMQFALGNSTVQFANHAQ